MNHLSVLPEITTSRLLLRASTKQDIDAIFELYSNPAVVRYLDHPVWTDTTQAADLIRSAHEGLLDESLYGWCVVLRETDCVIGTCALFDHAPQHRSAEIAFTLHPDFWRQGFTSELLPVVICFGFETLGLNRIHADVDPDNIASLKALTRAGFIKEGRIRECWISPGNPQPSDTIILGLLKSDVKP